jgi:prepilin-type N-terminal cleavage/methylation domain-containing protein
MQRRTLNRSGHARISSSKGFTLLDMIFVIALIGLLSAIAVPTLLRSRAAANETATLATIRVVHTGALSYALSCGAGLWPADFPALADPAGIQGFLPPDLTAVASPMKSGYTYTLQPGPVGIAALLDCNGKAVALDYYVTAAPIDFGNTGSRSFASNEGHVIWQDTTGTPPPEPFTAGGTIKPIE